MDNVYPLSDNEATVSRLADFKSVHSFFQMAKIIVAKVELMDRSKPSLILVADDEPLTHELIHEFLYEAGLNCKIIKAETGRKAYELAVEKVPHLIITDWIMPEFDGPDLIRKLKRNELTKDIPVVLTTGASFPDNIMDKTLEAGAVDCLLKPIEASQLVDCVKMLLHKKE